MVAGQRQCDIGQACTCFGKTISASLLYLCTGKGGSGQPAASGQGKKARRREAAAAKRVARPEPREEEIDAGAERERIKVGACRPAIEYACCPGHAVMPALLMLCSALLYSAHVQIS